MEQGYLINDEVEKKLEKIDIDDVNMDVNSDEVSLGDFYDEYYDDLLDTGYHGD